MAAYEGNAGKDANKQRKLLILLIVGFFTSFLGILILIGTALIFGEGSVNFGGVIFIWFIPIVFGAGPEAPLMVLFVIILAVLSMVMYLILRRKTNKAYV